MTNNKQQTAVDKAKELTEKMTKQYALIAVDEMLEIASPNKWVYRYTEDGVTILEQWPERVFWWWVKQEIEKL
jgi:hypothetical protein